MVDRLIDTRPSTGVASMAGMAAGMAGMSSNMSTAHTEQEEYRYFDPKVSGT